ncbi:thioesterase family protein [Afifella sp. YEN Y35]|uniref:thioesterase family protein n=1 Tax=Afifella sp. YEN Y35 TaxID=3388337 RepID=UPI0039E0930B
MYVWGRLLKLGLSGTKAPLPVPFGVSELSFLTWPWDCDTNLHITNGRYLMLADIGRFDLFRRFGLWDEAMKRGWAPMLGGVNIVFRREIRMWQRFQLTSRIVTWEGTSVVGEHRFVLGEKGEGQVAAQALTWGGIYDRKGKRFVPPEEMFQILGITAEPPEPDENVAAFLAAQRTLRERVKAG